MSEIIIISGSPSKDSRSDKILKYLGEVLEHKQKTVTHISVRDVPQHDLIEGRYGSPAIDDIALLIRQSQGVIIGSPVYKAAYSGVLKALLDLLPQDIFEHTPVLPIMTGGSPSHLLALEYTLKPLLATLKGHSLQGVYLLDQQIDRERRDPITDDKLLERTIKQLDSLVEKVNAQKLERSTVS